MLVRSNMPAVFVYSYKTNWEFVEPTRFSPKQLLSDNIRVSLDEFLSTLEYYDLEEYKNCRKVVAIDSPFSFSDRFRDWICEDEMDEEKLRDPRNRKTSIEKLYDSLC